MIPRAGDQTGTWTYARSGSAGVEIGSVRGRDVGLPPHFHDEDQVTFVTAGRRRFVIGGTRFVVDAGHGLVIRAGVAHRSLPEPDGVVALNLYLPPDPPTSAATLQRLRRLWRDGGCVAASDLAAILAPPCPMKVPRVSPTPRPHRSVREAAIQAGMSREGFSRCFGRRHGMPPHAYCLVARLNHARALLRQDERLAAAALEAGFYDQSHFGRCFRRAFGVTPGRYRAGEREVTTVPDGSRGTR